MKCQHCEKPATFHITELTGPEGPKVLHLCEDHAREFLASDQAAPASALTSILAKQLKMDKAMSEIASADKKTCPVCGITFAEFRKGGRLGCAYDYVEFADDLKPLLENIHGASEHVGKQPTNLRGSPERQRKLAKLREEMKSAIKKEEYERASELRDKIAAIESGSQTDSVELEDYDAFQSTPPHTTPTEASTKSFGDNEESDEEDFLSEEDELDSDAEDELDDDEDNS